MLPRGLLKEYSRMISFMLRSLDVLAIVIAGLIAYVYKFDHLELTAHYILALGAGALLTLIVFPFFRIYESMRGQSFWSTIKKLIQATFALLMLLAGLAFLTKSGTEFSRSWFILWGVTTLILLILFRCSVLILLRLMRSHGWNERRVIIIGAGELGFKLMDTMQEALWTGFRITAIMDEHPEKYPTVIRGVPLLKMPDNLSEYLKTQQDIDEIWLALPLHAEDRLKKLLHELRHHTLVIRFVLDIFGLGLLNHSITNLAGFPTINFNASPMIGMNRLLKAIEDRLMAAVILLFISPLLLLIALGVKCTSKGPVFFKQLRHGWDGRVIKVYKFRTMVEHQENDGQVTQAKLNDARITPFGKFLRRTSLDELPQFINVLQGRMSIVGPRPHAIAHNELYKDSIRAYMQRHQVKPGITGWAQVNGWRGETDTLEKMEKRVEYDLYYIENWSLSFDFKIIFLTLFQGFISKNAY